MKVLIRERNISISSSEFFAGHTDSPFLSLMLIMSTCPIPCCFWSSFAFSMALLIQQSIAMMFPLKRMRYFPDTDMAGISASSSHFHLFLIRSLLRHSSSVSISSIRIKSGRTFLLRVPARGLSRSDGTEGTSGSQRKFSRLPFAQFSLWTVILDDSLVFFEVRHKG